MNIGDNKSSQLFQSQLDSMESIISIAHSEDEATIKAGEAQAQAARTEAATRIAQAVIATLELRPPPKQEN